MIPRHQARKPLLILDGEPLYAEDLPSRWEVFAWTVFLASVAVGVWLLMVMA